MTKKLNDRNSSVTDSFYIVDNINKITDTEDFSNFKLTEEDKSKLVLMAIDWIFYCMLGGNSSDDEKKSKISLGNR